MLNTFLAKILLKFRIASPLWYTIVAAILVGFKYVVDSGVVAIPSDVSDWVLFLLSLMVSPGLSKYGPKVMILLLLPTLMVGQTLTLTQSNGQPIVYSWASITRAERAPVTHDTRIYVGSTFTTVSMNYDSLRTLATGHLIHVNIYSTWRPMLFSPKAVTAVTKAQTRAVVRLGSTNYATNSNYDSLVTVIDGLLDDGGGGGYTENTTDELNSDMYLAEDTLWIEDAGGAVGVGVGDILEAVPTDLDSDPENELIADFFLLNDTLWIEDVGGSYGVSVGDILSDVPTNLDNDPENEYNTSFSVSADTLRLTDGGGTLKVPISALGGGGGGGSFVPVCDNRGAISSTSSYSPTLTSPYTVILAKPANGVTYTVNLPTASGVSGYIVHVAWPESFAGSYTGQIVIDGFGSQTVGFNTSTAVVRVGASIGLISDGSNWIWYTI